MDVNGMVVSGYGMVGGSIEHGLDLIVESLIVEVVNFDGLEVFLGVEVPLGD